MEGRCNSTRTLAMMVGLGAAIMATPALAQDANNFGQDKSEFGHMARTLDQAIEWGATFDIDQDDVADLVARGAGEDPMMCVEAVDCAQPGDFSVFINASFFDSAEIMEFAQTGNLTEICSTFVFAGGSCPAQPASPIFNATWAWDFFEVDSMGIPSSGSVGRFDTEFPLANMTVANVFVGTIGAGFPVFNFEFDLGMFDTGMGIVTGFPVGSGDCFALQPKFALAGCSAFWEASSNMDGSASGDGISLQDSLMDGYDSCDYTANDLLLCLDLLTTQPPSCTSDVTTDAPTNDDCQGAATFPLICDATTIQCLLFATLNTEEDPLLPCALGEADDFTGEPTAFYTLVPTSNRVLLSMCRVSDGMGVGGGNAPFPNGDFILAVYEVGMAGEGEGPCNLIQIACSEDNCSANKPVLCLNDLTMGQTYVVEIAGHDEFDGIQVELDITCDPMEIPPVPANDDCMDATVLTFPFIDEFSPSDALNPMGQTPSGNTLCASLDPIAGGCGTTANGNSPGVWFTFMGTGMDVFITQCEVGGGTYDSQINVYCGDCSNGLICLVGVDDGTTCAPQSEVQLCTEVGRPYYIYVHGFFDVGDFGLVVRNNPDILGFCANDPTHDDVCVIFELDCNTYLGGAPDIDEPNSAAALMEMCGDDINNGCITDPNSGTAFIQAGTLPFTACGLIDAANNLRDLDAYRFTVDQRSLLTVTLIAEFNPTFFLFDSDDCATNIVTINPAGTAGTDLVVNAIVNAGTYVLSVSSADFSGLPCGITNDYALQVSSTPLGRCCIADKGGMMFTDCCITDEATCTDLGGVFELGEDCSPITYTAEMAMAPVPFNSIIGLGNEIVVDGGDGDGLLGDDDAQFIDLAGDDSDLLTSMGMMGEFPFKFFGELRDDVAVVSNGNLAFPAAGVVILDATPDPIPTPGAASTLNDYIGGLWTDLDPSATGAVSAALIGAAPFRTLVVEYNAVPIFNQVGTVNTFQIILFEGSNCIRFLYNDIELPVITDPMAPEYVVGVENQDGTAGTALTDMQITSLDTSGNSAVQALQWEFCPESELTADEACSDDPPVCVGDCDNNGTVEFNDLVSMLFQFGNMTDARCDADMSGTVAFNDLVAALFLFGPCP